LGPSRLFHRRYSAVGAPPGHFTAPAEFVEPHLSLISYSPQELEERPIADAAQAAAARRPGFVTWIDVQGLGDGAIVQQLGEAFGLHPLAISDIVNHGQRPKADEYETHLYVVLRMASIDAEGDLRWEQVSVVLGEDYVLSFQERRGDCLDPLRERVRKSRRVLRSSGPDYLACMILDAIVDGYFPVLELHGEQLEEYEDAILHQTSSDVLADVYRVKRDLMIFRRAAWPLREALNQLYRHEEDPWLSPAVRPYLRDTVDHVTQVVDVNETYRELAASLVDVYLSTLGQRTNDIMRVLTVIATIFIPLTFFAGVYGMNFDVDQPTNMPELSWRYGYLAFWVTSALIAAALLGLFRRLGWLGGRRSKF
jgi:magnesium transporter